MARRPPLTLPPGGFNDIAMCRAGPMIFNRHDRFIGASLAKYGEWSAGEIELLRQVVRPGFVVVEVGANIGAHTVELSRLVGPQGRVLAFEPQRLVFQTLCANLALNSCANVAAFEIAVGAEAGEIDVPFLPPDRPANFGGLSLQAGPPQSGSERVALRPLDALGLPACQLIKVDVEGMEVEVLRGAERKVAADRPLLYAENDRKERSAELLALLRAWNYRLFWHLPPLFSPANYAGDPDNIFPGIASHNLLCLPAERGLAVKGLREVA